MRDHGFTSRAAIAALAIAASSASVAPAAKLEGPARVVVTAAEGARVGFTTTPAARDGVARTGITWIAETSFGSAAAVEEGAPGSYATNLAFPAADMPRTALVVLVPQGVDDLDPAWTLLPIAVRTTLSAHTEPRSTVTATVAGRSFGPVEAGRDGSFTLDIELPPGVRSAQVQLRDVAGNVTQTEIAVPLRAADPLTVALDRYRVTSDGKGTARVFAFAFDDVGRPLPSSAVSATATAGEVSAFSELEPGLFMARWTAPRDGREGLADIAVTLARKGLPPVSEIDRVSIVRGLPGSLRLAAEPMELVAGAQAPVALVARVADAAGNPLAGLPVTMFAERGELTALADGGDGSYSASLAPPALVESGSLEVKALLAVGGPARIPAGLKLSANPKAVPTSWRAFSLITAVVTDAEGRPVPGEVVLFHVSRGEGRVTPAAITYDEGQGFADFAADPTEEVVTVEAVSTSVPSLRAQVQIEKRSSGEFTIISRPASVAQGGRPTGVLVLTEDKRILQDSVLLTLVAGEPARLVASADTSRLPADGASQSQLRGQLLDAQGNAILEQPLTWSVDRGTVSGDTEVDDGMHVATFTAPEGRGNGTATVQVRHAGSGLSATVPLELDAGPPAAIALVADREEMPADGVSRAVVTATVTDASGAAIAGADVGFAVTAGDAGIEATARTDAGGRASVPLTASLLPGDVVVEASADQAQASLTVRLVALRPERLEVTARPARIRADGLERAEILATVEDGLGQRIEDERLTFTLQGPGVLTTERATSDADGEARTWLSGDRPGIAIIRVSPDRAPGLAREVQVELVGDTLATAILVDAPSCAGAVQLRADAPDAISFEWDWTGDGIADARAADAVAPLAAGSHEVRLRTRDARGATGSARSTVVVLPSPVAVIEPVPEHVASGSAVRLDGSASRPGSGILAHAWDLDGDGMTDADATEAEWTPEDGLRTATLTVTDDAGCADVATVRVLFGSPPDLALALSVAGPSAIVPEMDARLRLAWSNAGPTASTATEIVISLTGPGTWRADALPRGGRLLDPRTAAFALGALPAGARGSFDVTLTAGQDFPGTVATIGALAQISCPLGDANPADNDAGATIVVQRDVDLVVALSASAGSPLPAGSPLVLTVDVTNVSGSDAPDVVVDVAWDDPLFEAIGLVRDPGGAPSSVSFDLGRLPARTSATRTITGQVRARLPLASQDLSFMATGSFGGPDPTPADNEARLRLTVTAAPDLAVSLEARPDRSPAVPGDAVAYELTWSNVGSTAAENVTITSSATAGTLASLRDNPDGGVLSGNDLRFGLGRVDPGEGGMLRWTALLADVPPAGTVAACNDAVARESAGLDPDPSNDTASRCVDLDVAPQVVVTVTGPVAVAAGSSATFVVAATNTGALASGLDLELHLAGALVESAGSAGDPLTLRFPVGDLPRGATATWRPRIQVPCSQAIVDPSLQATAMALSGAATLARSATHVVAIIARPDLAPALELLPATARAGETLTGRLVVANRGCAPCAADAVEIAWDDSLTSGAVSPLPVSVVALGAGASASETFTLTVAATLPALFEDLAVTAQASCPADADPSNDVASALVRLVAAPDVAVTLVGTPAVLAAGAAGTVNVQVANLGSTTASGAQVSLAPREPGLLAGIAPAAVALPDLAPGGTATASFTVTAMPLLPSPSTSVALVASATCASDLDSANDTATGMLVLEAWPDLDVTLEIVATDVPASPGSVVLVRATVANVGTTASRGGTLEMHRDPALLPPVDPADAGDPIRRPLPDMAPGDTLVVELRFVVAASIPVGTDDTTLRAVGSDALDRNPANDEASGVLRLGSTTDLGVDLTLAPGSPPLRAGDGVRATVKATNAGQRDATGVGVRLTWSPAGLVASAAGLPIGAIVGAGSIDWLAGDLPAQDPGKTWDILLELAPTAPATSNPLLIEVALISDPAVNPEVNFDDNRDWGTLDVVAEADLCVQLAVTASPARPLPGGSLTYEATVENRGSTAASAPRVEITTDPWLGAPRRVDAGGIVSPGLISWTLPALAPGAVARRAADFDIPAFAPGETTRLLTASARAAAPEDAAGGCPGTAAAGPTTITTEPDLLVQKRLLSSSDEPPRRGTRLTYEITVENVGNDNSDPGTLVDALPGETRFVSSTPAGLPGAGTISWNIGSVGPGVALIHRVTVDIDAGLAPGSYFVRNVATASSPRDANPANDMGTHELVMNLDVDLVAAMACEPAPAPALPGGLVRCSGSVRNDGSYPATAPRILVDTGTLATYEGTGGTSATIPLLPGGAARSLSPGETVSFSFDARLRAVMPAATNGALFEALAQADEPDADPADNDAQDTVSFSAWADLHAELAALDVNGPPLAAGDRLDLELTVSNSAGTMLASPVTIVAPYDDALFDLVAGGDLAGGAGTAAATLPSPLSPIDPPATLRWSLVVASELPGPVGTATLCAQSAAPAERSPNDDRACVGPLTLLAWPDLATTLVASVPATPASPGDTIEYTATVVNRGSTRATVVRLVDDRPELLTSGLLGASVPATDDGRTITMTLPDLSVGQSTTATWRVGLAATMPAVDTTVTTTACASSADSDRAPADNCASASVPVRAAIDARVGLQIVAPPGGCAPGSLVTLRIDAGNDGSAPARSVVVIVDVPAGLTVVSAPGSVPGATPLRYELGSVAAQAAMPQLQVTLRVDGTLPDASNALDVTATISHAEPAAESDPSDDSARVTLTCLAHADVAVTLVRITPAPVPGQPVTYRATVRNDGSTAARGVTMIVADDGTLVAPVPGGDPGALGRVYAMGDLAPGFSAARDLAYSVLSVLPAPSNTLVERVTLSTTTPQLDISDDSADRRDVVTAMADLWTTLALSAPRSPAQAGDVVTANVSYGNSGATASSGRLVVTLDPNVTLAAPPPGADISALPDVVFDLGSVAAGTSASVSLSLRVNAVMPTPATTCRVLALIEGDVADSDATNDADMADMVVAAWPDLVATIRITSPVPPTVAAGGTLTGEITIVNRGTTRATGTAATLRPLESGLVASFTCLDGPCTTSADTLTFSLGQLAADPGTPVTRRFSADMSATLPASTNALTLECRVSGNESELVVDNNVATAAATLEGRPDLKLVSIRSDSTVVRPNSLVRVDYVYTNVGTAPADPAELEVTYDGAALLPLSASGATTTSGTLTFDWGGPLAPGASASEWARFLVQGLPPPPNVRQIDQTAVARERAPILLTRDANPADNSASITLTGCYVGLRTSPAPTSQVACMGSGVTITADSSPATGVTTTWWAEGGLGRFSSTTGRTVTYFPPVTAAGAVYRVHAVVTDAATPTCTAEGVVAVTTTTSCTSCGCGATQFNVQYDSAFTRLDRYGDQTVTQGETVGFRVQLRQTQSVKAGWLLGGPGNTRMTFTDGGDTYTAWLAGDVWIECSQTYIVEFGPALVPATMDVGYRGIRFEFVTRDDCGGPIQRDVDNNTGDRVQVLAAPSGMSGIVFTEWGPEEGP